MRITLFTFLLVACSSPSTSPPDASSDADEPHQTPPPPKSEPGRHDVSVVETRQIIPGPGLPNETTPGNSNNNLDVVRHSDGRIYLAWRTGPDHFASPGVRMHVVSSTDEVTWKFEASFSAGSDLREPRFLSMNGSLFFFVSRLGTDPLKFEPQGISIAEKKTDGTWTGLTDAYVPNFIAWRTRIERGKPYVVGYTGGEHIYLWDGIPLDVHLLTTTDGRTLVPVMGTSPVISTGGGSETDFALMDDGSLFGIIRNEAGDATGLGSKVCKAPASDITKWTCKTDKKKYDSPLVFHHDGEVYLVARRNVTETGNYDLGLTGTIPAQAAACNLTYKSQPKRCSLWRFVQGEDRIAYILDLPSRGDTCFPARIDGATPGEMVIYNYSSKIDGPDLPWGLGQHEPTFIYRHVLRFAKR